MYHFIKENMTFNIADVGLKVGDIVTAICVGGGGGGGGGGGSRYKNGSYDGHGSIGTSPGHGYGGGGNGGSGTIRSGGHDGTGGGGGGSGYLKEKTIVLKHQTIPVTIGTFGVPGFGGVGVNGNGADGGNGTSTSFGTYLTALGGEGGKGGAGAYDYGYVKTYSEGGKGYTSGVEGGHRTNNEKCSEKGYGGTGYFPFLSGGLIGHSGEKIITWGGETISVQFNNQNNRTAYLGTDNNSYDGKGLVVLLWD